FFLQAAGKGQRVVLFCQRSHLQEIRSAWNQRCSGALWTSGWWRDYRCFCVDWLRWRRSNRGLWYWVKMRLRVGRFAVVFEFPDGIVGSRSGGIGIYRLRGRVGRFFRSCIGLGVYDGIGFAHGAGSGAHLPVILIAAHHVAKRKEDTGKNQHEQK